MSNLASMYDDVYSLIQNAILNGSASSESSYSSSSSDSENEIKVVKQFTNEEIAEKQVAVGISSMTNLNHGNVFDYEIAVVVQGQTFYENDPQKQQILQLFGVVENAIHNLSIDDIQIYIDNIAGFLIEDSSFENDQETNNFTINLKFYVTDLI